MILVRKLTCKKKGVEKCLEKTLKKSDKKRIYAGGGCESSACNKTDNFKMGEELFSSRCRFVGTISRNTRSAD